MIIGNTGDIPGGRLTSEEMKYVQNLHKKQKKDTVSLNRLDHWIYIYFVDTKKDLNLRLESCRKSGNAIASIMNTARIKRMTLTDTGKFTYETLAFAEGMMLGNYQFLKYKKDKKEKQNSLQEIRVLSKKIGTEEIERLNILGSAVCRCRDLVNEPVIKLNAEGLAAEFVKMGKEAGFKVEVLNQAKIESLKMGGLLAVNLGSEDPPTFTIMEYKPRGAVNKKPYVLVGKGVTFDSGGISLKPSSSMSDMKCDMSGAAAAGTAVYAIAKAKLPVWVVALIPATDNKPSATAQVPGDVITMFDGTTVEVLNTDAEGRLILADALAYAKKYKPGLVIDMATLTGAAHAAIGKYGIVAMNTKCKKEFASLKESGERVCERIVEFPLWDDYKELIKSDIADLKNIGGAYAGAITAGKFLEHFTDYPYIHLDIAGPAFTDKRDSYRGLGGTGSCVRLLFDFFLHKTGKQFSGIRV
jgi:leucyl aminopeptidase